MAGLLDFLLGSRANFYPFEKRIIEEVEARLNSEGCSRLQQQVEAINKIQRLADGKEVNLYQMRNGKPAFDEKLRFPDGRTEALLASARLVHPENGTKLEVKIWLVKGKLFSLEFNKSPKQFFVDSSLDSIQPEIIDVKIRFDPMHPPPISTDKPIDESALTGWLREWHAKGQVAGLHASLPKSEQATYLDSIDALLPPDYLELVAETEGVELAACVVYGLAGIRHVVLPEATYYMLAEIEGLGALAVKDGNRNAELYFLHYEDNDARPVGTSFQKAIVDLLKLET